MKLGISESIALILAIPAHRSHNEGHRKVGEKSIELLFEYRDTEDKTEKEYNTAMIGTVLSTVRAFSVERDRISEQWRAIEHVKERKERLLELFQNISPFSKGNYWSKVLVLISASGLSVTNIISQGYVKTRYFVYWLVGLLIIFELVSKIGEYYLAKRFEEKVPNEKSKRWEEKNLVAYQKILEKFIDEAIDIHRRCYPDENKVYGFNVTKEDSINELKEYLINLHFYFKK